MKKAKSSFYKGSIIVSTFRSKESAKRIAKEMIARKLCACVNITKINSIYFWDNKLQNDIEYLCLFKTMLISSDKLKKEIEKIHPYNVPEIVELKINNINKDYLNWMISATS